MNNNEPSTGTPSGDNSRPGSSPGSRGSFETPRNPFSRQKELPNLTQVSILAVCGALLLILTWLLPAHWKSLSPSVVERAGRGTQSVGELGLALTELQKAGPAEVVSQTAQLLHDPQAAKLSTAITNLNLRRPELAIWGGYDRQLSSLYKPNTNVTSALAGGTPILELLLPESSRARVRQYLVNSRQPGVHAILRTRDLTNTTTFVAVPLPGGQPFEATILLAGLLYQGEGFSSTLSLELKSVAESALENGSPNAWEAACLDLLTLGKRLDWTQLTELLRFVPDVKTLAELARTAKGSPEQFAVAYTAVLLTQSGDGVAKYLNHFSQHGAEYLAYGVARGQGAASLLVKRQLPLTLMESRALAFTAPLVLRWPNFALCLKAAGFMLAMLCFYVVWNELSAVETVEDLTIMSPGLRMRRGAVAVLLVLLLMITSEPFVFVRAGAPIVPQLRIPALANIAVPNSKSPKNPTQRMNLDISTILSIALFAALQIVVYSICLMKINEIDRQHGPPQLKLRLMENEENLFDSGLYVGIAGTATALVLQVMQLIEANLLAAYASNLFGILCVALVKIRHVRAFKRKLILRCQVETAEAPTAARSVA